MLLGDFNAEKSKYWYWWPLCSRFELALSFRQQLMIKHHGTTDRVQQWNFTKRSFLPMSNSTANNLSQLARGRTFHDGQLKRKLRTKIVQNYCCELLRFQFQMTCTFSTSIQEMVILETLLNNRTWFTVLFTSIIQGKWITHFLLTNHETILSLY